MSNNESIFGLTYCSHKVPYNSHTFITTSVIEILLNINLPLGQLINTWIKKTNNHLDILNKLIYAKEDTLVAFCFN